MARSVGVFQREQVGARRGGIDRQVRHPRRVGLHLYFRERKCLTSSAVDADYGAGSTVAHFSRNILD